MGGLLHLLNSARKQAKLHSVLVYRGPVLWHSLKDYVQVAIIMRGYRLPLVVKLWRMVTDSLNYVKKQVILHSIIV